MGDGLENHTDCAAVAMDRAPGEEPADAGAGAARLPWYRRVEWMTNARGSLGWAGLCFVCIAGVVWFGGGASLASAAATAANAAVSAAVAGTLLYAGACASDALRGRSRDARGFDLGYRLGRRHGEAESLRRMFEAKARAVREIADDAERARALRDLVDRTRAGGGAGSWTGEVSETRRRLMRRPAPTPAPPPPPRSGRGGRREGGA